jgi:hypothetical protein
MKKFQEMNEVEKVTELTTKLGLSVKEAELAAKNGKKQTVELTESHKAEDHKTFAEVDGSFRPVTADGKPVKGAEGKAIVEKYQRLASCYEALGLTKAESLIAATVECRLVDNTTDWSKFEF